MALSGSFNTTGYDSGDGSPDYLTFSWTATQSIANNTSTITWTVVVGGGVSSSYYNTLFQRYAKVGATEKTGDGYWTVYNGTQVFSGTETIQHASDGTGSFTAIVKGSMESWNANYNTAKSQTFTLDQIPRAAEITSAPNFSDTDSPVLAYSNPAGSAATLQAAISLNSAGTSLACAYRSVSQTAGSYTFTLTTAEKNALKNAAPNSKTMTVYFFLKSVIGSNTYYRSLAKTFTVANVSDNIPTVTISSTAPDNTSIPSGNRSKFNGVYIQNVSKLTASLTASGKYNATIASYSSSLNNTTYAGNSFTTNVLTTAGNQTLTSTATDSRGYAGSASKVIAVAAYTEPYLSNVSIFRSNSGGTAQDDGTYVRISAKRNFASVSGVNKAIIQYRYKASTTSSWGAWTTLLDYTASGDTGTATPSGFANTTIYNFQIRVIDYVGKGESSVVTRDIPTATVTLHLKSGGMAVGIGSYAGSDKTIATPWTITKAGISTSWHKGRDNPVVKTSSINGYSPFASVKTTNGSWDIGAYNQSSYTDDLLFSYVTDTQYAGSSASYTAQVKFLENGHIVGALDGTASSATNATNATNIYAKSGSYKTVANTILEMVYPVGSIYMSTSSTSPATFLGGTWSQIKGRFLLGVGANTANTATTYGSLAASSINRSTVKEQGGSVNKQLQIKNYRKRLYIWQGSSGGAGGTAILNGDYIAYGKNYNCWLTDSDNEPFDIMPPYFTVYMWERTA